MLLYFFLAIFAALMKQKILTLIIGLLLPTFLWAQFDEQNNGFGYEQDQFNAESGSMENGGSNHFSWGRDTTKTVKNIPIGLTMWNIDERLGTIKPAVADTLPHHFQNFNNTDGYNGQYNFLGNLGSPRLSRLFMDRPVMPDKFFMQPYDFFYTDVNEFLFANTKSPITNLSYHTTNSSQNGEDRVRAYFATNINKISGIGFKLDYSYGRGFYNNQATSLFNGALYGYYLGDRYNMHAWINANHFKQTENGGIDDDTYITNPESFNKSISSTDIPTILSENWNQNDDQVYFLTHRYNVGFYKYTQEGDSLLQTVPHDSTLLKSLRDSALIVLIKTDTLKRKLVADSLREDYIIKLDPPAKFTPVTSFIHTLNIRHGKHGYYSYDLPENYYTNMYYGEVGSTKDLFDEFSVKNTLGIALREGFNKWAKAGLTAFASHELRTFEMPGGMKDTALTYNRFVEHNVSVGGELSKRQGKLLHYTALGEIVLLGTDIGQFQIDGQADLNIPFWKDTLAIKAHAYMKNLNPHFYYRHYQSQFTWWNNDLSHEFRTRIEGELNFNKSGTSLRVGVENIKNYTYLSLDKTPFSEDGYETSGYSNNTSVKQNTGNIQVFSAILNQNFKFGIFRWDNQIAYQKSSNENALPLPDLSLYSNIYLNFRIAKVLLVELGGDVRYFTSYYAPDYSPAVNQFAVQDVQTRVKIGNYPICNVYANFHLKHCRFYAAINHVNASLHGNAFWAPHYPINPMNFHFGVSWNFFN